jgi:hypothetical protein
MAELTKKTGFPARMADHVADELVNVLSADEAYEFKALFLKVFEALKLRNAVSGGEEMLRLRCYEKLQGMLRDGLVKKNGKTYRGQKGLEQASTANRMKRAAFARSQRAGK